MFRVYDYTFFYSPNVNALSHFYNLTKLFLHQCVGTHAETSSNRTDGKDDFLKVSFQPTNCFVLLYSLGGF